MHQRAFSVFCGKSCCLQVLINMKNKFLIPFALLLLQACSKSENKPAGCVTTVASLSGVYKKTAITYRSSANATPADQFSRLPECEKDDTIELLSDGSLSFTDAGLGCGVPPPPGMPSSWTLENGNTRLLFADQAMTIQSFNCRELVLVETDVFSPGDSRATTYTKQ